MMFNINSLVMRIDLFYDEKDKTTKFTLLEDIEVQGFTIKAGFCSDRGKRAALLVELLRANKWSLLRRLLLA